MEEMMGNDQELQLGVLDELKDVMGERISDSLAFDGPTVSDGEVDGNGIAESAPVGEGTEFGGLQAEEPAAEDGMSDEDKALLMQQYEGIEQPQGGMPLG